VVPDLNDDEDGVDMPRTLPAAGDVDLTVRASAVGFLNAWIDVNGNGMFDLDAERILSDVLLNPGDNALTFDLTTLSPTLINAPLKTFIRYRFTPGQLGAGASPIGLYAVPNDVGEVEDYEVEWRFARWN
jgi:hypothetical protein